MTSKQVMLALVVMCVSATGGCAWNGKPTMLDSPYASRQVWAVAPLRNESGSLHADGAKIADHLAEQLEQVKGIDVLPVNRVLAAMQSLHMQDVATKADAMKLRRTLGADGLVIGTITSYNPYDPPKLGLAVELYDANQGLAMTQVDPRKLTEASTEGQVVGTRPKGSTQPVNQISGFYDAADPSVREELKDYAKQRGATGKSEDDWRLYRLDMDLYTEFVSHEMASRLIAAECRRAHEKPPARKPPAP